MRVDPTGVEGVFIMTPAIVRDERGSLSESYRRDVLRDAGIEHDWAQDNHVYTAARGVVRGLHWQSPPFAQAKLVRVTRGAICDVAVDIRKESATYGRHVTLELSAENRRQLYVPAGFAHGYCTLEENTEVIYKLSAPWKAEAEGGLRWDDPDLAIQWPITRAEASLNVRDQSWPRFSGFATPF